MTEERGFFRRLEIGGMAGVIFSECSAWDPDSLVKLSLTPWTRQTLILKDSVGTLNFSA